LWSALDEKSEISSINISAGSGAIKVTDETFQIIKESLKQAEYTHGAFDPTVGLLLELWGFRKEINHIPSTEQLQIALAGVSWKNVNVDDEDCSVQLADPNTRLDLGGIAKGYAVDRAFEALRDMGETDFLINLAGNMRAHGRPAPTRPGWRIGIRNPFAEGTHFGTLVLADGEGIATSGSYERYVIIDGVRHGHILDPRNGRPVSGMIAVTVVATSAMEADALSTALFVLGPEAGAELLQAHPGCGAIFVPDVHPRRLRVTRGLKDRFRPEPAWRAVIDWL